MEKGVSEANGGGAWTNWVPTKLGELKKFFAEVKLELKKVTWPGRPEVRSTTLVVIFTTMFFGFYLWGLDVGFSYVMAFVLR